MCEYAVCTCIESKGKDTVWLKPKHTRTWSQRELKIARKTIVQADKDNVEIDRKNKRVENQVTKDKELKIVCIIKNLADDTKEKGKIIN